MLILMLERDLQQILDDSKGFFALDEHTSLFLFLSKTSLSWP